MDNSVTTPGPGKDRPPADMLSLLSDYGPDWQIEAHPDLPVWTATRRSGDGRHIQCIVAHSPAELGAKLAWPLWTITRAGADLRAFEARKGGAVIRGATLAELAQRIGEAEQHPPS